MPRVTTVKKAQKDYPEHGIKKGETYYWWKFRYGGKHMSKTYPKPSQLTQSDYLSQLYDIQDQISECQATSQEDLESFVEEIKETLENLKSETEDKLSNMPDQLQYSPTGELLQERIDALDNVISEFDSIDFTNYEEKEVDDIKEELKDENDEEDYEPTEEEIEEKKQEYLQEWIDEKINEIQSISLE